MSCTCHCDGEVLEEGIEVVCHIPVPVDEVEYLIKQDENRRLCHGEEVSENPGPWGCDPCGGAKGVYAFFSRYLAGHVYPGSFGPVAGVPGGANESCDSHFVRNCRSGLLEQVLNSCQAGCFSSRPGDVVQARQRVGLSSPELGDEGEYRGSVPGLSRQSSQDRAGVFSQGLGEVRSGEELFRILVVRRSFAVNHLVKGDGELVRVE